MPVAGNADTADHVVGASFDNRSGTMDRAGAGVADTCDRDAANCKMRGAYAADLATMAGGIVQATDVRHGRAFKFTVPGG